MLRWLQPGRIADAKIGRDEKRIPCVHYCAERSGKAIAGPSLRMPCIRAHISADKPNHQQSKEGRKVDICKARESEDAA